jgi:hypothetical protein
MNELPSYIPMNHDELPCREKFLILALMCHDESFLSSDIRLWFNIVESFSEKFDDNDMFDRIIETKGKCLTNEQLVSLWRSIHRDDYYATDLEDIDGVIAYIQRMWYGKPYWNPLYGKSEKQKSITAHPLFNRILNRLYKCANDRTMRLFVTRITGYT